MQPQYFPSPQGQYNRPGYHSAYNSMPKAAASYPQTAFNTQYPPATYQQPNYYPQYHQSPLAVYNNTHQPAYVPGPYQTYRGRGGFPRRARGFWNRHGVGRGWNGGGYGGGRGAPFPRRRQFVGGSLETHRKWERSTACCFFLQGRCKFGGTCYFLHENDGTRPCQFGGHCRLGHPVPSGDAKAETKPEVAEAEKAEESTPKEVAEESVE